MKKIITTTALTGGIFAFFTMINNYLTSHPNVKMALIILGGFLALALAVWFFKKLCRLIGSSMTSTIFLLALGATTYFLLKYHIVNPFIGYYGGLGIGLLFGITCIRWLGKKAETSLIIGEIFGFFTNYKLKTFIERETIVTKETKRIEHDDYDNIVQVLVDQMKFVRKEAKEAAQYVIDNFPTEIPLEDKIREALRYQGETNKTK